MRNDPHHELEAKIEGHRRRLDILDGKLRDRSTNLNDLHEQLRKLKNNIGDHSITTIAKKADDAEKKLDKTNSRLDKQSAKIAEVRRDLETVHRKVRVSSGLPHADFDTWEQISPETITAIRVGLASTPVPETKLQQLRKQQEGAQKELVQWDRSLETAKLAVQGLTELPPAAERAWRKEARMWFAFRKRGPRPVEVEQRARQQRDEALRAHESATEANHRFKKADHLTRAVIRERVEDAVARDLLFPPWFESALGCFPPREPDRIERWLDAATNLVRYRLVAGVRSRVHPFGERPEESWLAAEYDEVVRHCAGQRR